MSEPISRYPLQWPVGWKRTDAASRKRAKFSSSKRQISVWEGIGRVQAQLRSMGVSDMVISTNIEVRLDGMPRSDRAEPRDPGAAVYWTRQKGTKVMAIDWYDRVADNLAAIAATLEALRAIERHGGAVVLERAFAGFAALPAPGTRKHWREILGIRPEIKPNAEFIRNTYRELAAKHHPDRGGSAERMAEINAARDQALQEISQ